MTEKVELLSLGPLPRARARSYRYRPPLPARDRSASGSFSGRAARDVHEITVGDKLFGEIASCFRGVASVPTDSQSVGGSLRVRRPHESAHSAI